MKTKIKKLCATIVTVILSVICAGCGDLSALKTKYIAELDAYYGKIEELNEQYHTVLIEYEIERGKEKINQSTDSLTAAMEVANAKQRVERVFLTAEEDIAVKQLFCNWLNSIDARNSVTPNDDGVFYYYYYMGQYGNNHIIYKRISAATAELKIQIGPCLFVFPYFGVEIQVLTQNTLYHLDEAYALNFVTDEQVKLLYDYYQIIREHKKYLP